MICLYKTNQRGGSGNMPQKIKSQKIKRNFFMFFIKSADKTIFLWYNYTNLKFYSEREMCYIYDL